MNRVKAKASALLFVLVMLFIVTLLANVVLRIMLNQSRLSRHRIWRVRGLYAAQAARVLTMEKLRTGIWLYGTNHCINSCPTGFLGNIDVNDDDTDLISSSIGIAIGTLIPPSGHNNTARIDITVMYQRSGNY